MEQETNILSQKPFNILLFLLIGLVLGFIVGFFISKFFVSPNKPIAQVPQIQFPTPNQQTEKFPVPKELFFNPVVKSWSFIVYGTLVEKGEDYVVLENKGQRLKIYIGRDEFFPVLFLDARNTTPDKAKPISYENVPLGVKLSGTAEFLEDENRIVAYIFRIEPLEEL